MSKKHFQVMGFKRGRLTVIHKSIKTLGRANDLGKVACDTHEQVWVGGFENGLIIYGGFLKNV